MARCQNCGHPAEWHAQRVVTPDGDEHPRACGAAFCVCLRYERPGAPNWVV